MRIDKVCVLGLGYIGLPTAALIASRGVMVHGVDINQHAVDTINAGNVHIVEPELDIIVRSTVGSGHLRASTEVVAADVFVIAVPTPFKDGRVPDISYVEAAARSIAPALRSGNLIILESTSPVGTTERVADIVRELRPELLVADQGGSGEEVAVAYCPERVLPGRVLHELVENDRVIGGLTPNSAAHARAFYGLFVRGECVVTDARTAEMTKLTENAFRDVNIAFANELSLICHQLGIDVWELIGLANRHPRVGILNPGPGVGGHCIAVDPWFIVHSAPEQARLIRAAREVNDAKPHWVVEQVRAAVAGLATPRVLCLGLAFKADIDDLRESPALEIVRELALAGIATVTAVEPHVAALPANLASLGVRWAGDAASALAEADVAVILVDHRAFKALGSAPFSGKRVIDTRGMLA